MNTTELYIWKERLTQARCYWTALGTSKNGIQTQTLKLSSHNFCSVTSPTPGVIAIIDVTLHRSVEMTLYSGFVTEVCGTTFAVSGVHLTLLVFKTRA
jgi:hypothetical protein